MQLHISYLTHRETLGQRENTTLMPAKQQEGHYIEMNVEYASHKSLKKQVYSDISFSPSFH
jgi:hypothetical protein